jgi:hypothetical protein
VKNDKLSYVFITVLGVILLALFFPLPMFPPLILSFLGLNLVVGPIIAVLIGCFVPIVAVVFIVAGLCGIGSQYFKRKDSSAVQPGAHASVSKHSKLYQLITGLGFAFVVVFLTIFYLGGQSAEVSRFFSSTGPLSGFLMVFVFLFGGTVLFTLGVCGVVRPYFNNYRNQLTMLVAISLPSFIIITFFYMWFSALQIEF